MKHIQLEDAEWLSLSIHCLLFALLNVIKWLINENICAYQRGNNSQKIHRSVVVYQILVSPHALTVSQNDQESQYKWWKLPIVIYVSLFVLHIKNILTCSKQSGFIRHGWLVLINPRLVNISWKRINPHNCVKGVLVLLHWLIHFNKKFPLTSIYWI